MHCQLGTAWGRGEPGREGWGFQISISNTYLHVKKPNMDRDGPIFHNWRFLLVHLSAPASEGWVVGWSGGRLFQKASLFECVCLGTASMCVYSYGGVTRGSARRRATVLVWPFRAAAQMATLDLSAGLTRGSVRRRVTVSVWPYLEAMRMA